MRLATIKKSLGVQVGKSTDLRLLLFNDILLLCTDREVPQDPKVFVLVCSYLED